MPPYDHSRVLHFVGTSPTRISALLFLIVFVTNFTGGNSIDKAPPSAVKDFVEEHGGHTVITKVR